MNNSSLSEEQKYSTILDELPLIYTDSYQLCSPAHKYDSETKLGPPSSNQIVQSKLMHRRVKLNVGGVRYKMSKLK